MILFKIINTLSNYSQELIFIIIFVILLYFFFRDFNITNKNSWLMLLGFSAMGGFFLWRSWKRAKILKKLEKRERDLEALEKKYNDELKNKARLSDEAYMKVKSELDKTKEDASRSILQADKDLSQEMERIKNEYNDISTDELLKRIKETLNT